MIWSRGGRHKQLTEMGRFGFYSAGMKMGPGGEFISQICGRGIRSTARSSLTNLALSHQMWLALIFLQQAFGRHGKAAAV